MVFSALESGKAAIIKRQVLNRVEYNDQAHLAILGPGESLETRIRFQIEDV